MGNEWHLVHIHYLLHITQSDRIQLTLGTDVWIFGEHAPIVFLEHILQKYL
jgi:hypothetical protein